jgi:hypothetical protein
MNPNQQSTSCTKERRLEMSLQKNKSHHLIMRLPGSGKRSTGEM